MVQKIADKLEVRFDDLGGETSDLPLVLNYTLMVNYQIVSNFIRLKNYMRMKFLQLLFGFRTISFYHLYLI